MVCCPPLPSATAPDLGGHLLWMAPGKHECHEHRADTAALPSQADVHSGCNLTMHVANNNHLGSLATHRETGEREKQKRGI